MKTLTPIQSGLATALLVVALNAQFSTARAVTTINATNKYAYGANIGWRVGPAWVFRLKLADEPDIGTTGPKRNRGITR